MVNGSERSTDKFLENRAADPRNDLRDEDEEEYGDQQSHDGGRWQSTRGYSSTLSLWCDVYIRVTGDRRLIVFAKPFDASAAVTAAKTLP